MKKEYSFPYADIIDFGGRDIGTSFLDSKNTVFTPSDKLDGFENEDENIITPEETF